jgi:hypothetical protein
MQDDEKKSKDFDGIYFLPGEEDGELILSFFDFKNEMANGEPIEISPIGYTYHIAFFKKGQDGHPVFDDSFEAILGDPGLYVKNLAGAELFGCVIKKTTKSAKWFEDYLTNTAGRVMINRMISNLQSILSDK